MSFAIQTGVFHLRGNPISSLSSTNPILQLHSQNVAEVNTDWWILFWASAFHEVQCKGNNYFSYTCTWMKRVTVHSGLSCFGAQHRTGNSFIACWTGTCIRASYCPICLRVSRIGLRKDAGSTPRFGSHFSSKIVNYGHCLMTLPCTINETLKWLTSLAACPSH